MKSGLKRKYLNWLLLCLIICLGAGLRFYNAGEEPLWFDEMGTWDTARGDMRMVKSPMNLFSFDKIPVQPGSRINRLQNVIRNTKADSIHMPLYFICVYLVKSSLGDSALALRLLSIIPGILSILIIYLLANFFFKDFTALLSAAFMALLWFPIYYSREARMYSLMILCSLWSTYMAVRFYASVKQDQPRYRFLLFFYVTSLFNAYLHFATLYYTGLQSVVFFIFLFLHWRKSRPQVKKLILLGIIQLIALIPAIYYILSVMLRITDVPNIQWLKKPGLENFLLFFNTFLNYPDDPMLGNYARIVSQSPLVRNFIVSLCLVAAVIGYDRYIIKHGSTRALLRTSIRYRKKELLLLGWLFVPVILQFIISLVLVPAYMDRYLVYALPPLYILLARCICSITRKRWLNIIMLVLFTGLALYDLVSAKDLYTGAHKMQFKEALSMIADNKSRYAKAVLASDQGSFGIEYYINKYGLDSLPLLTLQKDYPETFPRQMDWQAYPEQARREAAAFLKYQQTAGYLWYITINYDGVVKDLNYQGLEMLDSFYFYKVMVMLYKFVPF